jgi:hypothetical protein
MLDADLRNGFKRQVIVQNVRSLRRSESIIRVTLHQDLHAASMPRATDPSAQQADISHMIWTLWLFLTAWLTVSFL